MPDPITPENPPVVPATPTPEVPAANDDPNAPPATPEADTPPAPAAETPPAPEPKKKFTKRERLEHAQGKIERQLEELNAEEDDDRPVTVGDLKKMKRDETLATSIELANDIEDEDERAQVIELLEDRITPSGDPEQDLALARGAVNSVKNAQVARELARKDTPPAHSSAPGGPGKPTDEFTPTAQEAVFMKAPYNLSKEDVVAARQKTQAAQ